MSSNIAPLAQNVNVVAARWAAKNPDLAGRIARAKALVANVTPGDYSPNVFFVEGSAGKRYMVRVNRRERASTCTCEDFTCRKVKCKHILAAALWERGQA